MVSSARLKLKTTKKRVDLTSLTSIPKKEVHFDAEVKDVSHRSFYASQREKQALIVEVGDAGLLLYEYYLSLVGRKSKDEITDHLTAEYFGWTVSKAKRIRQDLTNAGWFRSESFTYSSGRKGVTYYLGKGKVENSFLPGAGFTGSTQRLGTNAGDPTEPDHEQPVDLGQ